MTVPPQATLTGTCVTKLAMRLSSQAAIGLRFSEPSIIEIANFPTITYPAQTSDGFTITTTVSLLNADPGTFNPADGSIWIPPITLQITVNITGSYSTGTGMVPINLSQIGYMVAGLTTGPAPTSEYSAFNDQGSPLQASGQITLVGDGAFFDNDGQRTTFLGMTDGAITLAGTIPLTPMTTVPDVIGETFNEARADLRAANLKAGGAHLIDPRFVVTGQDPQAGATVPVGTVVILAMGPDV